MEQKIATYQDKKVYVYHLCRTGHYALVSYKDDDTCKFKININELTNLQTVQVKQDELKEGDN